MQRGKPTLTYDVVLWTKGVYHSLVPVASEPLDDYLHDKTPCEHYLPNLLPYALIMPTWAV